MSTKTKYTRSEALEEAFKQFPGTYKLNRCEIARVIASDIVLDRYKNTKWDQGFDGSYYGEVLVAFLEGEKEHRMICRL